jgi:signal transduction histidine kinase
MRISHRLWLICVLAFLLFMTAVGVGWFGLRNARDSLADVFENRAIPMQNLASMQKAILINYADILKAYAHDPSNPQAELHKDHTIAIHLMAIEKNRLLIDRLLAVYATSTDKTETEQKLANELFNTYLEWDASFQAAYFDLMAARYDKGILAHFLQKNAVLDDLNEIFSGLIGLQGRIAKEEYNKAEQNFQLNQSYYIALFAFGTIGVFGGVVITIHYITRSFAIAGSAAEAIANGDLNEQLCSDSQDEFGEFMQKLQRMQYNLLTMVDEISNSEARWKFALEGAGDGVWDWNPQTDAIMFSPRWLETIACTEAELPTTCSAWLEHCHPDDKARVSSQLASYLGGKLSHFAAELRMCSQNNVWKWISVRGKLVSLDDAGKPLRVIGTLTDISETKTLQAHLNQAQKLESIGQLAAGIAHEINTPIQYIGDNLAALAVNFADIQAYHQALQALDVADINPKLAALAEQFDLDYILTDSPKAIAQSQDGVNRVAEIVKAMKTFSHVESSQSMQRVNLAEIINSTLVISRNSYKHIAHAETNFASDANYVYCFAGELNQVILNLIINAAHAIEEKHAKDGLISISTRKLAETDSIEILIADNGNGIPAAIQDKVFDLFFTTKPVGVGTGQGLNLAYNIIVEKHKGKLFFDSTVGVGTTFHIQLPINQTIL